MSWQAPMSSLQQRRRKQLPAIGISLVKSESAWDPALDAQDEAARLKKEYEIMHTLGQGSASVVWRARRQCDGLNVSLKVVRTTEPELIDTTRRELGLLLAMTHPNIIRGYEVISTPTRVVLVMELFEGLTLQDAAKGPKRQIGEEPACRLFGALISAVAYLHECGVVHRDVKAENVLVSVGLGDLRLIDFNTAQRVEEGGALTMTGTRDWAAPEVLRGDSPGMPHDVWGAGLCLFYMLAGRLPKKAHHCRNLEEYAAGLLEAIARAFDGGELRNVAELCQQALRGCLEEEPGSRLTAGAALAWCSGPRPDMTREGPIAAASQLRRVGCARPLE